MVMAHQVVLMVVDVGAIYVVVYVAAFVAVV